MTGRPRLLYAHIAATSVVGVSLFGWLVVQSVLGAEPRQPWALAVLALLLVLSEQRTLVVIRRGDRSTMTLSAIFACAILLRWGIAPAVLAQAAASLVEDLIARRAWWKSVFNVAQYTISLFVAGVVYHAIVPPTTTPDLGAVGILGALGAGAVFFVLNTVLAGTAIALAEKMNPVELLLSDLTFQASVNGTMAGLAPIVLAVVNESLWLVPLLLIPAMAVYHGGRLSLEKEHLSRHDALTELPNRLGFGESVAEALADAERRSERLALMMMDIDGFRDLNDTLGHSAGDALLRQIGARLVPALSADATLARLGGDEFGILVPEAADEEEATAVARAVHQALAEPFEVDGVALDVRASLGIAVYPDHGESVEDLVRAADVAMYQAKRDRSGWEMFDPNAGHHSRRRLTILNELRPAVTAGSLVLYYQPKVDMRTGSVSSLEALVRWPHPVLGMVPPVEFIPLAEYTGLIRPLTEMVLRQACAQLAIWQAEGTAVPVAVNVSARVIGDAGFPALVGRIMEEHGVPAELLILELTESAMMADPDGSLLVMRELAEMGIRLSIDDFGTGYSSLAYLSRMPVSEVKIDRSFVTHVDTQEQNRVIVGSTIELARNLGLEVAAEGIETMAAWQTLARLGCTTAQGYLISRPEPEPEVSALLRRGASGVPLVDPFTAAFGVETSTVPALAGGNVRVAGS